MEIKTITGHTGLTGLLGSPVSHSISPLMHNEAFRLLGLDYVYLCFDVGTDTLKTAVEGLKTIGIKGFNCTMPDKNLMCELCDELSPAARMIGAVNTVLNDNGKLIGYNTDGVGYMRSVTDAGFSIIGKKMTLLGAGGAAVSICTQAAIDGVSSIDIYNRPGENFNRAVALADTLNKETACQVSVHEIADATSLNDSISESAILVNGTSLGMAPNTDTCPINDASVFHSGLIVSDIIYNPRETKLLKMAKECNCSGFNGLYMLLYQGAAAFELWTGKGMPVDIIKQKYFQR